MLSLTNVVPNEITILAIAGAQPIMALRIVCNMSKSDTNLTCGTPRH